MMAKKADTSTKRLVSLHQDDWARWLMRDEAVVVQAMLSSDFQWIQRESDIILRVEHPTEGVFLLVNEVQLRYELPMPVRLMVYSILGEERYQLPVYPVLINILPPSSKVVIPDHYESNFMGMYRRFNYRVINLWELEAEEVLEREIYPLIPMVPVMQGGDEEAVLRRATRMLREHENIGEMETILAFFAEFVFAPEVIRSIMRFDMTILRESELYKEILQEGIAEGKQLGLEEGEEKGILKGRQLGIEEGVEKGRQQERLAMLQLLLSQRFGTVPPALVEQLQQMSSEQLLNVLSAILTSDTIQDFQAHLPPIKPNGGNGAGDNGSPNGNGNGSRSGNGSGNGDGDGSGTPT
jgi:predicted transposase YdaD